MSEKIDLKARHNARKCILQALYLWQLDPQEISVIEEQFSQGFLNPRIEIAYFKELLYGIPKHHEAIDAAFSPYLSRPFKDVDPVELAVLRLATYELLFRLDIPYPIVINEALELTKTFGTQESYRFINGALDKVAKTIRLHE